MTKVWIPKTIQDVLKELKEEDKDLIQSYIEDLSKRLKEPQIIQQKQFPFNGTELNLELRKNGKVLNMISVPEPKGVLLHFPPKNPEKISLLVLKNHFARLELFTYKKVLDKLFLSVNGEIFKFENGNEAHLSCKILNYVKYLSPFWKRRRKRYRKK